MLVTLKEFKLVVLSFEGSRDPLVNDIVTKANMKLTMARYMSGKK